MSAHALQASSRDDVSDVSMTVSLVSLMQVGSMGALPMIFSIAVPLLMLGQVEERNVHRLYTLKEDHFVHDSWSVVK